MGIIVVLSAALVAGGLWVWLGGGDDVAVGSGDDEQFEVPDVVGEDVDDAIDELEDLGLRVRVREAEEGEPGVVDRQDPEAGEDVEEGDRITIFVGPEAQDDDGDTDDGEPAETADADDDGFSPPEAPEPPGAAPPIVLPEDVMGDMSLPQSMPESVGEGSMSETGSFDAVAAHADVIASTTTIPALTVTDVEQAAQSTCAWLAASGARSFEQFQAYDLAALVFVHQPLEQPVTQQDVIAFLEQELAGTGDVVDPAMYDGVLAFATRTSAAEEGEIPQDAALDIGVGHLLVVQHACPQHTDQLLAG